MAGERARLLVDILGTSTQEKSGRYFRREKKTIWIALCFVSFRYVKSIEDVVFLSFPLGEKLETIFRSIHFLLLWHEPRSVQVLYLREKKKRTDS